MSYPTRAKRSVNMISRINNVKYQYIKLPSQLELLNTPTTPLQSGKTPHPDDCPVYDSKQSDGEVTVMMELWGMRRTPSLPSLPGPLWLGMVAPDRVLSKDQKELNCELVLNWIVWNRIVFTVYCVWTKTILLLNWIVWIRTVWLNWILWNRNVFDF